MANSSLAGMMVPIMIGLLVAGCYGTKHVGFEVCTRNDTWTRPAGVWDSPQYVGSGGWGEPYQGNFLRNHGSASLSSPWMSQAGLKGFSDYDTGDCGSSQERHERLRSAVEIWTVLYDVIDVTQVGEDFRVHVRPIDRGFRAIQFDAGGNNSANVDIVGPDGRRLACFGPASVGGRCR